MHALLISFALLAQPAEDPFGAAKPVSQADYLREVYRGDAKQYVFQRGGSDERLELVEKPIMRWSNDDDWSGDVFVWAHRGRPEVVGCILSGPGGEDNRLVFHEFHLLAKEPIADVDMLTRRRWTPKAGLSVQKIEGAPEPAASAVGRLTQMRQLAKEFTAHMEADGTWELRLLPQPLLRWGKEGEAISDGALFGYVWTKGTDLEVMLLLECSATADGPKWHYAPVRFSNRSVWLRYDGQEVWRVEGHEEPKEKVTTQLYTTAYAKTIPRQAPIALPAANKGAKDE